jgi:hypothetical protein
MLLLHSSRLEVKTWLTRMRSWPRAGNQGQQAWSMPSTRARTHSAMPIAKLVSVNGQCRPGHDGASHLLLATLQRTASGWHWLAAAKPRQTLNPEPDPPSQGSSKAKPVKEPPEDRQRALESSLRWLAGRDVKQQQALAY